MDKHETVVMPPTNRTVTSGPLVSVGVPTYNRPEQLRSAILRLFEQTYSNLEIVVSDNCSTMPEVGQVLAELAARDDRLVCFRQERNIGLAANHKFVLQKATGEFFIWLADDDEIPRDYIEKCVAHFADAPEILLVGPKCDRFLNDKFLYAGENYSNIGERTYTRLRRLIPRAYYKPHRFEQHWSGVFRREALAASLWKPDKMPFRTIFTVFFRISEKGCIQQANDVVLRKNTTPENFENYRNAGYIHRPWRYRWLGRDMEETLPVTFAMFSIILASRNLNVQEKSSLVLQCATSFSRATVRIGRTAFKRRARSLRRILTFAAGNR